jgi:phosphatidylethanolamine/phosphatidyl-N-methylethanolamine N-methyltransferase
MSQNNHKRNYKNHLSFILTWIRSPRSIGAVIPSSKALSKAMAAQIELSARGDLVEIGAGTGVVTKEVLARLAGQKKLLVIERNEHFFNILHKIFPTTHLINDDAQNLMQILADQNITEVNAIISSLPLLSLPATIRGNIIAAMAQAIGENGRIIQFTYGLNSPIPQELLVQNQLKGECKKLVICNIPPAKIWVYQKDR